MKLLVFQHTPHEHLGGFRPLLEQDGHALTICQPARDGVPEALDGFDGIWVLGGPMQVWEADRMGWLRAEIDLVAEAVVGKNLPYFGICLGHQLLAQALGGQVGPAKRAEVGMCEIEKVGEASGFQGLPDRIRCFQWHSAEVQHLPEGATTTATSTDCAVQAMEWGDVASSVQFHAEISHHTLRDWFKDPSCIQALQDVQGPGADLRMLEVLDRDAPYFSGLTAQLYRNWMRRFD